MNPTDIEQEVAVQPVTEPEKVVSFVEMDIGEPADKMEKKGSIWTRPLPGSRLLTFVALIGFGMCFFYMYLSTVYLGLLGNIITTMNEYHARPLPPVMRFQQDSPSVEIVVDNQNKGI